MSSEGLKAAFDYGAQLPEFENYEEAQQFYFGIRDRYLRMLTEISGRMTFNMDYSPESLKSLEKLYFQLHERNLFEDTGTSRETFECCMGFYYGEVVVRNCAGVRWEVRPFGFTPNKFELMVRSEKRAEGVGCRRDFFRVPKNRKQQQLWKNFEQWVSQIAFESSRKRSEAQSQRLESVDYDPLRAEALPDYPRFLAPEQLSGTEPKDWSQKEADLYLEWIKNVIESRTDNLLKYFNGTTEKDREAVLLRLGHELAPVARSPRFVTVNGPADCSLSYKLTDQGYALAADFGLLLARFLLEHLPSVHWEVVRKPKRHASYNLPVLKGWRDDELDPFLVARAQFFGVLDGSRNTNVWRDIFRYWKTSLS